MEITEDPVSHDKLLALCSDIIKFSVKTGNSINPSQFILNLKVLAS